MRPSGGELVIIGQLTLPGSPPKPKAALSQWFTPPVLARRIVHWANPHPGMRVLEPSAGSGSFVVPLLAFNKVSVEALEIDPEWAHRLGHEYQWAQDLTVHNVDFLQWQPNTKFDLCVANPPFEDDQDCDHLVHALNLADRVVALVRTNIVHGVGRYNCIWKHVHLKRKINFIDRPHFSGAGSPRHDFCVIDMAKGGSKIGTPMVATEWWYASK